jgi:hypothetical protein
MWNIELLRPVVMLWPPHSVEIESPGAGSARAVKFVAGTKTSPNANVETLAASLSASDRRIKI